MKFRLKDQAMQAKLDAISNGDFSDRLQETVLDNASIVVVSFGESPCECCKHRYVAIFKKEEIYEIPPYTPNQWNPSPEERGYEVFNTGLWTVG